MLLKIESIIKNPLNIFFSLLGLTLLFGIGIKWIYIDDDIMKMLPKDIESRKSWEEIQNEFGNIDLMFITLGNENESVLTTENLKIIWDLTYKISANSLVKEVVSISNLDKIEAINGFMEVSPLQQDRTISNVELETLIKYIKENQKINSQFFDKNFQYTNIIIRPIININNNELVNSIVPIVETFNSQIGIHYSGQPYLTGYVPELIQNDVYSLIIFGIFIMIIILLLNLKSLKAVAMVFSVIILSLISMMGFMGWMLKLTNSHFFYFTMVHSSMPIILLTIANSDSVHVIAKFFREYKNTNNKHKAIQNTISQLNMPIFLTSFTTAVAFLTLISAPINPLIGYGITISFGIMWAWVLSTIFLPSLISLVDWDPKSGYLKNKSFIEIFVDWIIIYIQKFPKLILNSSLLVAIIAGFFIFSVQIDVDFKSFFEKGTTIRQSIDFMDEKMGGYLNMVIKIEDNLKSPSILNNIDKVQNQLDNNEEVSFSFSIVDIIKKMHKSVIDNNPVFETIPETQEKINNLFTIYSMSGNENDFSTISNEDYTTGLINVRLKSVSTENANKIVQNTSNNLSQYFTEDSYTISGILVIIRDMANLLVKTSFVNIFSAILLIFVISRYFFKSYIWGFLSVIPLSFAVLLNYGIMGVLNIKLSHVTAILSSIIIGVGVDFAIHFIAQFREKAKQTKTSNITKSVVRDVGYPIFLDSASNMAFSALILSTFTPVKYIGVLMFFAMVSCSFSTILILGSISQLFNKQLRNLI
ncbi:MAG: hypothetical protein CMF96_12315 [Candidatus Marinimicrobia bacterium]|nr:hypothetical protein [Candidatus Neomarinimicrobiota bacterium]